MFKKFFSRVGGFIKSIPGKIKYAVSTAVSIGIGLIAYPGIMAIGITRCVFGTLAGTGDYVIDRVKGFFKKFKSKPAPEAEAAC